VVGQFPSQSSPDSTTPLPHLGVQLLSLFALQPGAHQPSPFVHVVIAGCVHNRLHVAAEPVNTSPVHEFPSSGQVVGQFPSQSSPDSTTPLPHIGMQFASLFALQPVGQHESPAVHVVIGVNVHVRVHIVPVRASVVQEFASLHDVGQFPSQASPDSITPFPQTGVQFGSLFALQPGAQQPSPPTHVVIGVNVHARLQPVPMRASVVQEFESLHDVGQLPSQTSPDW
jgi:hypothetical protein